ncbi:MAG: hypothetical protein M3N53_06385 [Actinomycetota bacterium]|nr:hypothetical protein [Actinomycetota bacterium]
MWEKLNREKLGDVEIFWAEAPGPLAAALMFRVGTTDESIPTRGITHMVEHLALQRLGRQSYGYNGLVDHLRTSFFVTGSAEEVVGFLDAVTGALVDLPLDRLEHERQVLLTETDRHTSGPLDWSLAIRYGPRGPGLSAQEEFGLHSVTIDDIAQWTRRYFRAENAVLWISGPPPDGLSLQIPAGGQRVEVPVIEPVPMKLPAWYEIGERGMAIASIVPRATAASALSNILENRLQASLRYERGISYETSAVYLPLAAEVALQGVWTDTLKQNVDQARDAVLTTVDHIISTGPSDAEIERYRTDMERAWNEPSAVPAILDSTALSYLLKPSDLNRDVVEEARAVQPADVRVAAELFKEQSLSGLPVGSKMPRGYNRVPEWSEKKVRGKTYQPTRRSETALTHHRLVQGEKGVTLIQDRGRFVSITYDACEGLIRWSDGLRLLFGSDGFMLRIHPNDWRNGKRIVAELDRRLGDRAVEMRADPPPHRAARWDSGTYLRWALISAFFALSGLANVFDPEHQADGSWGFYLVMFLVLLPIAIYNGRQWFLTRRT